MCFPLSFTVLECACARVCISTSVTLKASKQKADFSLMSNPMFYRVELLITDNPAAPPFLSPCLAPHSSIVASSLSLSLFTSYPSPFLCPFSSLSLFIPSVFTRELASCDVWLISTSVCCVGRYSHWCGSEPSGASKADYELILAKEAGNSFKPTKLFH